MRSLMLMTRSSALIVTFSGGKRVVVLLAGVERDRKYKITSALSVLKAPVRY